MCIVRIILQVGLDWSRNAGDHAGSDLRRFVAGLIQLRKSYQVVSGYFEDEQGELHYPVDEWFSESGTRLNASQLPEQQSGTLGLRFRFDNDQHPALIVLINNTEATRRFQFPDIERNVCWRRVLSTADKNYFRREVVLNHGWFDVPDNSVIVIEEQLMS